MIEDNNFLNFLFANFENKEEEKDGIRQLTKIIKELRNEFIRQGFDKQESLDLTIATISMVGNLMRTTLTKVL